MQSAVAKRPRPGTRALRGVHGIRSPLPAAPALPVMRCRREPCRGHRPDSSHPGKLLGTAPSGRRRARAPSPPLPLGAPPRCPGTGNWAPCASRPCPSRPSTLGGCLKNSPPSCVLLIPPANVPISKPTFRCQHFWQKLPPRLQKSERIPRSECFSAKLLMFTEPHVHREQLLAHRGSQQAQAPSGGLTCSCAAPLGCSFGADMGRRVSSVRFGQRCWQGGLE